MPKSAAEPTTDSLAEQGVAKPIWHVVSVGFLLFATLLTYSQILRFEFVGYDDPMYIGDWPTTKIIQDGLSAEGLTWIWTASEVSLWEPLSYLSHMFDAELFGCGPESGGQHHLANLLLHVANVLLVYLLGVLLFRQPVVAMLAAGLFGLHPMRAETVGWVSERKGLLCAFFMLMALCSYVKFARPPTMQTTDEQGSPRSPRGWMIVSVAMTILAMMSKPAAVVIPLLVGLLDIYPLRRCGFEGDTWRFFDVMREQLREKWMFVLAALCLTCVSIGIQYGSQTEKFTGALPLYHRIVLIPATILYYVQRTFLPQRLNFEYPAPSSQAYLLIAVVVVVLLTWLALENYRKLPGLFLAWGWFLACLLPVCGLAYVGTSFTADRYTYFAHIGLFLGLGIQCARWIENSERPHMATIATVGSLVLVAGSAVMSARQTSVWANNFALFKNSVAVQPTVGTGYTNLAVAYERKGRPKEAIALLEQLYVRKDGKVDYSTFFNMGRLYGLLAADPANKMDPKNQVKMYELALTANPDHGPSLHNYGKLILQTAQNMPDGEKKIKALEFAHVRLIRASEKMGHQDPLYLNTLARSCMVQGAWKEAKDCVNRALEMKFEHPALRDELWKKKKEITHMEIHEGKDVILKEP